MDEGSIRKVLEGMGCNKIRRSGDSVLATCPFAQWTHKNGRDRNPSFSMKINSSGESPWGCFACGASGTAKGLIYQYKEHSGQWLGDLYEIIKLDQDGAPEQRFKKLGSYDKKKTPMKAWTSDTWYVEDYEPTFDEANFKEIMAGIPRYALDRGITVPQAKAWKLGYHKDFKRLFFPVFDETQKMVGWSGRAILPDQEPKYWHVEHMRREKYLYGEHRLDKTIRVGQIMEGFMDVLRLDRYGIKNCLGTMGTSVSAHQVEKLKRWFDIVIVFPHNDPENMQGKRPGTEMANSYKDELEKVGVKVIIAPIVQEKKDPGDWSDEDCDWVMEMIRRQNNGWTNPADAKSSERQQRREKESAHGAGQENGQHGASA